jgi:hypothetical protein
MAIQTSILSRRWIHLPHMLSRLIFNVNEFVRSSSYRTVGKVMASYSKATRKLLASTRVCAIKDLHLSFYLAAPSCLRSIGQAVGIAVVCREWEHRDSGVRYISRDSKWRMHWRAPVVVWTAPHVILRWLPQCLQMADAPHFVQYAVWRRGHPEHLERMQEAANTLLRSVLKIDAPNSQLVVLEFIHCSFSQVELVCVPQLARLVYDTWFGLNPPVRFGYVHRLQDIRASSALMHWQAAFTMSGWLSNTTSLSTLSLDFYDEMVCCKCSIV